MPENKEAQHIKEPLVVTSESVAQVTESATESSAIFPKRYEITIDVDPNDPDKLVMKRRSENLLGYELVGILELVLADVKHQVMLRNTRRSDSVNVPDQDEPKDINDE